MEATFRYTIIAHSPILNNADRLNGQPKIGLFSIEKQLVKFGGNATDTLASEAISQEREAGYCVSSSSLSCKRFAPHREEPLRARCQ